MAFILILKNAAGSCKYDHVWDIINELFQDDVVDQVFTQVFDMENTFYKAPEEGVSRDWEVTFKKVNALIAEFIIKSTSMIEYAPGQFWKVDVKEHIFIDDRPSLDRDYAREIARLSDEAISSQLLTWECHSTSDFFPIPKLSRQYAVWQPYQVYFEYKNDHYMMEVARYG